MKNRKDAEIGEAAEFKGASLRVLSELCVSAVSFSRWMQNR